MIGFRQITHHYSVPALWIAFVLLLPACNRGPAPIDVTTATAALTSEPRLRDHGATTPLPSFTPVGPDGGRSIATPTPPPRSAPTSSPTPTQVTPVSPSPGPARILAFDIAPHAVAPGEPITLTWSAIGEQVVIHKLDSRGRLTEPSFPVAPMGTLVIADYELQGDQTSFLLTACSGEQCDNRVTSTKVTCTTEWFFPNPPAECPLPPSRTTIVAQPFERGWMLWLVAADWRPLDEIVTLFEDKPGRGTRWEMSVDPWQPGMPEQDPDINPPAGLFEPVRGFGKVWRENLGVRDGLGWATAEEFTMGEGAFQCERQGYSRCFVTGPETRVFVLEPEHSGWFVWTDPRSTPEPPQATRQAPAILHFSADPVNADPGDMITLHWESTGGVGATIEQWLPADLLGEWLTLPASGTTSVVIKDVERHWHDFKLVVANEAGETVERSVRVQIRCPFVYFFEPAPQTSWGPGCPYGEAAFLTGVEQRFENGRMLWLEGIPDESTPHASAQGPTVFVLYDSAAGGETRGGRYEQFDDAWTPPEAESDPSIVPPEGLYQPVRGFGRIWRENPAVSEGLGWALAPEQGYEAAYQVDWHPYYLVGSRYLRTAEGEVIWLGTAGTWGFVEP